MKLPVRLTKIFSAEIQTAVRLPLPGERAKHAVEQQVNNRKTLVVLKFFLSNKRK